MVPAARRWKHGILEDLSALVELSPHSSFSSTLTLVIWLQYMSQNFRLKESPNTSCVVITVP
jgi:hypothetical protein